ncbi:MAG: hypothetical protein WAL94_06875, partial [Bacteroidales bacterium]
KGGDLLAEIAILYPQVSAVSYSEALYYGLGKESPDTLSLVIIALKGKSLTDKEEEKVEKWLKERLNSEKLRVYYEK